MHLEGERSDQSRARERNGHFSTMAMILNSSVRKMDRNHPGQRLARASVTSSDFLAAGWVRYAGATCLTRQSVNETRQVEEHKF